MQFSIDSYDARERKEEPYVQKLARAESLKRIGNGGGLKVWAAEIGNSKVDPRLEEIPVEQIGKIIKKFEKPNDQSLDSIRDDRSCHRITTSAAAAEQFDKIVEKFDQPKEVTTVVDEPKNEDKEMLPELTLKEVTTPLEVTQKEPPSPPELPVKKLQFGGNNSNSTSSLTHVIGSNVPWIVRKKKCSLESVRVVPNEDLERNQRRWRHCRSISCGAGGRSSSSGCRNNSSCRSSSMGRSQSNSSGGDHSSNTKRSNGLSNGGSSKVKGFYSVNNSSQDTDIGFHSGSSNGSSLHSHSSCSNDSSSSQVDDNGMDSGNNNHDNNSNSNSNNIKSEDNIDDSTSLPPSEPTEDKDEDVCKEDCSLSAIVPRAVTTINQEADNKVNQEEQVEEDPRQEEVNCCSSPSPQQTDSTENPEQREEKLSSNSSPPSAHDPADTTIAVMKPEAMNGRVQQQQPSINLGTWKDRHEQPAKASLVKYSWDGADELVAGGPDRLPGNLKSYALRLESKQGKFDPRVMVAKPWKRPSLPQLDDTVKTKNDDHNGERSHRSHSVTKPPQFYFGQEVATAAAAPVVIKQATAIEKVKNNEAVSHPKNILVNPGYRLKDYVDPLAKQDKPAFAFGDTPPPKPKLSPEIKLSKSEQPSPAAAVKYSKFAPPSAFEPEFKVPRPKTVNKSKNHDIRRELEEHLSKQSRDQDADSGISMVPSPPPPPPPPPPPEFGNDDCVVSYLARIHNSSSQRSAAAVIIPEAPRLQQLPSLTAAGKRIVVAAAPLPQPTKAAPQRADLMSAIRGAGGIKGLRKTSTGKNL